MILQHIAQASYRWIGSFQMISNWRENIRNWWFGDILRIPNNSADVKEFFGLYPIKAQRWWYQYFKDCWYKIILDLNFKRHLA